MNRFRLFFQSCHPIVRSLLVGTIMARAAASMSLPFLALYLAGRTGLSPFTIGLIIGAGSLAGTLGGFFGGSLSDRFGRKGIMMAALYVWGAVFLLFSISSKPLPLLILSILNGLCRSFYEPVSQALMADLTEKSARFRIFSLRYTAINIGVAVGPLLGAYFGLAAGPLPFVITGLIYLLYAISLHSLLIRFGIKQIEGVKKEQATVKASWAVVRRDLCLRMFMLGGMAGAFGYSQMTVTLSQVLEMRFAGGVHLFALLLSINACVVILLQVPLSRWSERRSPIAVIAAGNLFFASGHVGFAFANGQLAMIAAMVLFTIGEILNYPAGNMLTDSLAPDGMRGTYYGAQGFSALGQFLGPSIGGLLLSWCGGTTLFMIVAATTLLGTGFYFAGIRLDGGRRISGKKLAA